MKACGRNKYTLQPYKNRKKEQIGRNHTYREESESSLDGHDPLVYFGIVYLDLSVLVAVRSRRVDNYASTARVNVGEFIVRRGARAALNKLKYKALHRHRHTHKKRGNRYKYVTDSRHLLLERIVA